MRIGLKSIFLSLILSCLACGALLLGATHAYATDAETIAYYRQACRAVLTPTGIAAFAKNAMQFSGLTPTKAEAEAYVNDKIFWFAGRSNTDPDLMFYKTALPGDDIESCIIKTRFASGPGTPK